MDSAQVDWMLAIAPLANEPPDWMRGLLVAGELAPANGGSHKRLREVVWSRGMLRCLEVWQERSPECKAGMAMTSSIAHDRMYAAVLYGHGARAGVDIEQGRGCESALRIAGNWFPSRECAEIANCANVEQRFLLSWTLKEAWAKYSGLSVLDACHKLSFYDDAVHAGPLARCAFASARIATSVVSICVDKISVDAECPIRAIAPAAAPFHFNDLRVDWRWLKQGPDARN